MITVSGVYFSYPDAPVLHNISFEIAPGEMIGIIGPNGAGKSTLLKVMANILPPARGSVRLNGRPLASIPRRMLARQLGYLSQTFQTAFDFTAREIVRMGRFPYVGPLARETAADREMIKQVMRETGVWDLRHRRFSELSGGERQRVVLASALGQQPAVLLLDEPTAALDLKHQARFYDMLRRLQNEKGLTMVTVTHDINLAARFCQRLMVMKKGAVIADDTPEKIVIPPLMASVYEVPVVVIPHPVDGKPLLFLK